MKVRTKIKISIGLVEFPVGSIGTLAPNWVKEDSNWPVQFPNQPVVQVPSQHLTLIETEPEPQQP